MKRSHILLATGLCVAVVAAWDGHNAAASNAAPLDLVAKAGGHELTGERLAALVAYSGVPPTLRNVAAAADLWVSYQLVGYASAHRDTIYTDTALVDNAMWDAIYQSRQIKFYENVRLGFPHADMAKEQQDYAQGKVLAAQHILFMMPGGGAGLSKAKQDSIRNHAEQIRRRVTSANFGQMAAQYTEEPGAQAKRGELGVFPPGQMAPEFEAALIRLPPGGVSPALVQTQFGFHIIRRNLFSEVRGLLQHQVDSAFEPAARDAYLAKLHTAYAVVIRPGAAQKAKTLSASQVPEIGRRDSSVLATSTLGNFTVAHLQKVLLALPRTSHIAADLAAVPDTAVERLLRSFIDQELINAEAIKAGIRPDTTDMREIRGSFVTMVRLVTGGLSIDIPSLADSGKTTADRERLAAARVERALDKAFRTGGEDYVEVTPQLASALRARYPARVNVPVLSRVADRATNIRRALDSTHAKPGK